MPEEPEEDDLSLFERFMERFFGGGSGQPLQQAEEGIRNDPDPSKQVQQAPQPPVIIQMPQPRPARPSPRSVQADRTLEALAASRSSNITSTGGNRFTAPAGTPKGKIQRKKESRKRSPELQDKQRIRRNRTKRKS